MVLKSEFFKGVNPWFWWKLDTFQILPFTTKYVKVNCFVLDKIVKRTYLVIFNDKQPILDNEIGDFWKIPKLKFFKVGLPMVLAKNWKTLNSFFMEKNRSKNKLF